jgi:hypothetical protein
MVKKAINCSACTNYYCKKIAKSGGFRFWGCLLKFWYNNCNQKGLMLELISEARIFLPEYNFRWSGGICICDAPYGDYVWHYAVQMKQERIWNHREFREGRKFGLNPKEPYRDANPYQEPSRKRSWDCGYILGLHDKECKDAN